MEALKQLFKTKAEFVRSQEEAGDPPTDDQLASFLRNLTAETGLALRGAPPEVKDLASETNINFVTYVRLLLPTCHSSCWQTDHIGKFQSFGKAHEFWSALSSKLLYRNESSVSPPRNILT